MEQINTAQRDALRALELLIGRYPGTDIELRERMPALPSMVPVGIPAELLTRCPDINAASNRVYAGYYSTKQAKAARLPSFGLSGQLGAASESLFGFFGRQACCSGIGFQFAGTSD